ncbi:MAG: thioredoxin family protein [Candidatus Kapabacteria bacterium]|nr:thioredoxin family protein [Candidatus Kapabacteria bacterium]
MDILILGPGCMNCVTLEKRARTAVRELNINAEIFKISDYAKIAEYGVMKTPAMVIDEKVIFYGKVPSVDELKEYITKGVN